MDFTEALALFEQLSKTRQRDLLEDVLESSVRYARIRTDRYLADLDRRREMDESRTRGTTPSLMLSTFWAGI